MIFITALVLIFILRLRFPKGKSVAAIEAQRVTLVWAQKIQTEYKYKKKKK